MIYFHSLFDDCPVRRAVVFCAIGNFVPIAQKRSAGMRTAAYNVDVASIVVHLQSKCSRSENIFSMFICEDILGS